MKKKMFILSLTASIIFLSGCTNIKEMTSPSTTAITQEKIAASVDVNEEVFSSGSARIEESGSGVAKMKARTKAREELKKKLFDESETILKAYLLEIDFYSKKISNQVITDLGEYVAEGVLFESKEKSSWIDGENMYVVLSVDKNQVPLKTKETFIGHLDSIMVKLSKVKEDIESIPMEGEIISENINSQEEEIILEENPEETNEFIDVQL
jgi:protein involved in sex pheromone biosynthesis